MRQVTARLPVRDIKDRRLVQELQDQVSRKVCDGVKILGNGELTKKLTVKVNAYSASAEEKIKSLGGIAEVI